MLRSISFHPSGDFILVGTQHPTLRLYDINTFQCFVSCNPQDQHTDAICSVNYNASANMYVTGSKDGCIKLWDGVSNRCITTFEKAHDGAEVCSAIFSKNSKYILSSGKDSVAKLWEISTGRTLVKYTGMWQVTPRYRPFQVQPTAWVVMLSEEQKFLKATGDGCLEEKLPQIFENA